MRSYKRKGMLVLSICAINVIVNADYDIKELGEPGQTLFTVKIVLRTIRRINHPPPPHTHTHHLNISEMMIQRRSKEMEKMFPLKLIK